MTVREAHYTNSDERERYVIITNDDIITIMLDYETKHGADEFVTLMDFMDEEVSHVHYNKAYECIEYTVDLTEEV